MTQSTYNKQASKHKPKHSLRSNQASPPITEDRTKNADKHSSITQYTDTQNSIPNITTNPNNEKLAKKEKFNKALATKRRREALKKRQEKETKSIISATGMIASLFAWAKGAGNACAGIAASPILQFIGYGIFAASIGYAIWLYFN